MIFMVNGELKTTALNLTEQKLDVILQIMQSETFSMTKASCIVGGNAVLKRLIAEGKIEVVKPNKKWFCNAAQVLRYAKMKQVKPNKTK